eukprot:1136900-Pelagomonas_calceolata.AAC.2
MNLQSTHENWTRNLTISVFAASSWCHTMQTLCTSRLCIVHQLAARSVHQLIPHFASTDCSAVHQLILRCASAGCMRCALAGCMRCASADPHFASADCSAVSMPCILCCPFGVHEGGRLHQKGERSCGQLAASLSACAAQRERHSSMHAASYGQPFLFSAQQAHHIFVHMARHGQPGAPFLHVQGKTWDA